MYKHIIWDFDGTLFDSYPVMGGIFKELLEEDGFEETLEEILKYMKVSMSHAVKHYENKYNINSDFMTKYAQRRNDIEVNLCKPYTKIEELCKHIYTLGKSNYLYTHRGESAIKLLKKYGLHDYFSDFIIKQSGFERKPSPDAINYLVNKFNMNKNEAIMIGDRDLDILSAKNAGIHACFFSDGGEKSDIADFSISSFEELFSII